MSAVSVSTVTPIAGVADEYLQGLGQRVRMWRLREGKSYFSMPSSLWDEVVAAARQYPLRLVSRETGVNRDELKQRLGLANRTGTSSAAVSQAALEEEGEFIEMPGAATALLATASPEPPKEAKPAAVVAAAAPAATDFSDAERAGQATVQVTAADGVRLTVHIPVAHLNIQSLIQQFRGGL